VDNPVSPLDHSDDGINGAGSAMGNAEGIVDSRDFAINPRGCTGRSPDFTVGTPESAIDDTDLAVGNHDFVVDNPVFAVDNPVR